MGKVASFFASVIIAAMSYCCVGNKAEADDTQHLISSEDKLSGLHHYQQRMKFNDAKAESLCAKGSAFFEKGNFDEARRHLLKALELEPQNAVILTTLGHVSYESGSYSDAIEYYNRSHIIYDPTQLNAGVHLGRSYYLNGEYEKCIIVSKHTASQTNDEKSYYMSYYNMTKALIKQGKCEAAEQSFKKTEPALNNFKALKSRIYVLEHELKKCAQR
ncbi:tetratricopeptide repeat protein [Flavobacterium sp.]|uniref:tetratricopeptide repeat protein n=1 Tax=Flavobacterium sp. TaxID=239 RepID=UPI00120A7967|nr:tetratricopeptide repeat protein [Flavobacterium sp.]RZJ70465.1 MAG: tetratricopeptide repeat protein [Flavobacterium sp.]